MDYYGQNNGTIFSLTPTKYFLNEHMFETSEPPTLCTELCQALWEFQRSIYIFLRESSLMRSSWR
jgi:hypothetical protein